mmetsp:Transcript_24825/g.54500  ORF Transcript_24825/g.54500 Transcript_24825/m.54500 type:complete len:372 (-) Transcript_24825:3341-4456(-)
MLMLMLIWIDRRLAKPSRAAPHGESLAERGGRRRTNERTEPNDAKFEKQSNHIVRNRTTSSEEKRDMRYAMRCFQWQQKHTETNLLGSNRICSNRIESNPAKTRGSERHAKQTNSTPLRIGFRSCSRSIRVRSFALRKVRSDRSPRGRYRTIPYETKPNQTMRLPNCLVASKTGRIHRAVTRVRCWFRTTAPRNPASLPPTRTRTHTHILLSTHITCTATCTCTFIYQSNPIHRGKSAQSSSEPIATRTHTHTHTHTHVYLNICTYIYTHVHAHGFVCVLFLLTTTLFLCLFFIIDCELSTIPLSLPLPHNTTQHIALPPLPGIDSQPSRDSSTRTNVLAELGKVAYNIPYGAVKLDQHPTNNILRYLLQN